MATRAGDLLVFRKEELVLVLAPPAAQAGHAIVSVLPCARGFLVATERVRLCLELHLLMLVLCTTPAFCFVCMWGGVGGGGRAASECRTHLRVLGFFGEWGADMKVWWLVAAATLFGCACFTNVCDVFVCVANWCGGICRALFGFMSTRRVLAALRTTPPKPTASLRQRCAAHHPPPPPHTQLNGRWLFFLLVL